MTDVLTAVLASAAFAAVSGLILRNWLASRIPEHMAREDSLNSPAAEYAAPPRSMVEQAAGTLTCVYEALVELQGFLEVLQQSANTPAQARSLQITVEFNAKWWPLVTLFRRNRIHFTADTARELEGFVTLLMRYSGAPDAILGGERRNILNPGALDEMYERVKLLSEAVPPLLLRLQSDFQRLLGLSGQNRDLAGVPIQRLRPATPAEIAGNSYDK